MSKLYVYKKCISSKHNCINYIKIWKSQKSRVNKNNFEKYKDIPCGKFNHNLKYKTDKIITERQKNNKSNLALHRRNSKVHRPNTNSYAPNCMKENSSYQLIALNHKEYIYDDDK